MTTSDTRDFATVYHDWHILENWTGTGRMARAALNLHKPTETPAGSVICGECASVWPCNTYTAIEKAAHA